MAFDDRVKLEQPDRSERKSGEGWETSAGQEQEQEESPASFVNAPAIEGEAEKEEAEQAGQELEPPPINAASVQAQDESTDETDEPTESPDVRRRKAAKTYRAFLIGTVLTLLLPSAGLKWLQKPIKAEAAEKMQALIPVPGVEKIKSQYAPYSSGQKVVAGLMIYAYPYIYGVIATALIIIGIIFTIAIATCQSSAAGEAICKMFIKSKTGVDL
ncbi:MAG: hypothetical protein WCJ29_00410 [bacterium]